jgi:MoaA/NifB/PqqE/SkfB family radical SAM enzyme
MRSQERRRGLLRAPKLAWDVLMRGRYAFKYDQMPMLAARMFPAKRLNLFKAGANLLGRRLNPCSMPLHMQFELTNYCNLRCPVCPTGSRSMNRAPRAMDVDVFERVMNEVGPYLLTASLWAWGEPLLHRRLKEILRAARRHDVVSLLSTNGQCLNDDRVLEALTEEPPAYLIVAFDGLTDETNSKYRVGAKVAPILEGVRRLAEMKRRRGLSIPVLNMRYIVMKHNQHELPRLDEFARQNGFELLTIRNVFFIESTCDTQTSGRLTPDADVWRRCGYARAENTRRGDFICLEPFWFPTVFADGTVVLCEQDYNARLALGRVAGDVSFTRLWYGQRAARLRQIIRDERERVSFCRKCPYLDRPITDFNVEAHYLAPELDPSSLNAGAAREQAAQGEA